MPATIKCIQKVAHNFVFQKKESKRKYRSPACVKKTPVSSISPKHTIRKSKFTWGGGRFRHRGCIALLLNAQCLGFCWSGGDTWTPGSEFLMRVRV
jgi:hypothetical protein